MKKYTKEELNALATGVFKSNNIPFVYAHQDGSIYLPHEEAKSKGKTSEGVVIKNKSYKDSANLQDQLKSKDEEIEELQMQLANSAGESETDTALEEKLKAQEDEIKSLKEQMQQDKETYTANQAQAQKVIEDLQNRLQSKTADDKKTTQKKAAENSSK